MRHPPRDPWWLRLISKPLRYYLALRQMLKTLERPDEVARQIEETAAHYQRGILTLMGKEEPPDDAA